MAESSSSSRLPRCCCVVPAADPFSAVGLAVAERPSNHTLGPGVLSLVPQQAAAQTSRLWRPGRTLRVRFLDGSGSSRRAFWGALEAWQKHINLGFVAVKQGAAEIRVTFRPGGSWSYLGTDALTVSPYSPTLQIGWGPDRATCLHEIGHLLGLIHEHQNPRGKIPWNVPAVYAYYRRTQGWDEATTKANVLDVYSESGLTNFGFDPRSVMLYPVASELLLDPSQATGMNLELSPGDITGIGLLYPSAAKSSLDQQLADALKRLRS